MTKKYKIGLAVAATIFMAILAYWYFSPYLVIHEISVAARASNSDAMNDHIDYPRLRDSIKGELTAKMVQKMGIPDPGRPDSSKGFKAFGMAVATSLMDRMVDTLVQPAAVMAMMRRARLESPVEGRADHQASPSGAESSGSLPQWIFKRAGVDRLIAYAPDVQEEDLNARLTLVFEREGFANWKLVAIHLPR